MQKKKKKSQNVITIYGRATSAFANTVTLVEPLSRTNLKP